MLLIILVLLINVSYAHEIIGERKELAFSTIRIVEKEFYPLPSLVIYNEPTERTYRKRIEEHFGKKYKGLAYVSWGITKSDTNKIIIYSRALSKKKYQQILAHELIHRYQFDKGVDYCKSMGIPKLEEMADKESKRIINGNF